MCKRIFQFRRMFLLLGLPAGLLLVGLAKRNGDWVEWLYAKRIHLFLERTIGRFVSLFPFSVTEILICAAILFALGYIGYTVYLTVKRRGMWKHIWYRFGINVLCAGSMAYFLFVMTMGLNYYRWSVTAYLGFETRESTTEELEEVCLYLAEQVNQARAKLSEDENGVAQLIHDSWWETSAEAKRSFNKMAADYAGIGTLTARNKPMIFSELMSRTLTRGVYFPFTLESNINVAMPAFTVPSTMCHELSHVKGFMREDEANFLGFLACTYSEQADFRYSGYMMAFNYALQQLAAADMDRAVRVAQTLDESIIRDDNFDTAYWAPYRHTVIADTSGAVYDAYLQSNDQKDGRQSYGRMVDLVMAWYREVK